MEKTLTLQDYQSLAEFRHQIRRYLRFSEKVVRNANLEPRQYQLLLALKGLPPDVRPRIAELAEQLQIQHHSAVELVDRLESSGLVRRERGKNDRREVLVTLTFTTAPKYPRAGLNCFQPCTAFCATAANLHLQPGKESSRPAIACPQKNQ
jgi:MarR family